MPLPDPEHLAASRDMSAQEEQLLLKMLGGVVSDNFLQTQSNRRIYMPPVTSININIEDIAHGLSHICRFAGQTKKFYSVAEHSVHVANLVGQFAVKYAKFDGLPPHVAQALRNGVALETLCGLLHDAAEAYTGDVPAPVKRLLPTLDKIEEAILLAIADKFEFLHFASHAWMHNPIIRAADRALLITEAKALMPNYKDFGEWPFDDRDMPSPDIIKCWSPEEAKSRFLSLFKALHSQVLSIIRDDVPARPANDKKHS